VPADHAEELSKNKLVNKIRMRFISPIYLIFAVELLRLGRGSIDCEVPALSLQFELAACVQL